MKIVELKGEVKNMFLIKQPKDYHDISKKNDLDDGYDVIKVYETFEDALNYYTTRVATKELKYQGLILTEVNIELDESIKRRNT